MEILFPFGKYKGWSLSAIVRRDPKYLTTFIEADANWAISMRKRYPNLVEEVKTFLAELETRLPSLELFIEGDPKSEYKTLIIENATTEEYEQIKALIEQLKETHSD